MNTNEFWSKVEERTRETGERFGQAAFNLFWEINPDMADAISGTDRDPFNIPAGREHFDARMMSFADFLVRMQNEGRLKSR